MKDFRITRVDTERFCQKTKMPLTYRSPIAMLTGYKSTQVRIRHRASQKLYFYIINIFYDN
jgi:hypothetical protein